jgi:hypothetical protein
VPLLAPGAPIANAPGETLAGIDTETLAGNADTLAFLGVTVGTNHRRAVLRLQKGALEVVASEAGPLPDGVGAFLGFPLDGSVAQTTGTIGVGKGIVAFLADIEHPTATRGIFAATKDGVRAVVLTGDPAPRGTVFIDLGMPTVRQRSIVFPGTTDDGPACLFATAAPGKPFTAVACLDDPVPAPIGGAISDFLTLPSGIASDLYVPIAVQGGTRDECLVRVQKKKTSVIRCRDDVYVGGLFYGSFEDAGIGITTDAKGKNLLGLMQDNSVNAEVFPATQGKTIVSLLTSEVTAAPTSGGSISPSSGTLAGSIAGKTVVLAGGINGGSAAMAIFRFVLP